MATPIPIIKIEVAIPNKNPAAVALGKLGGKAGVKNPAKARTSEQARAAINARWAKVKQLSAR